MAPQVGVAYAASARAPLLEARPGGGGVSVTQLHAGPREEDGPLVGAMGERAAEEVARLLYVLFVAAVFPVDFQRRVGTGQRPAECGFLLVPLPLHEDSRHPLGRWAPWRRRIVGAELELEAV